MKAQKRQRWAFRCTSVTFDKSVSVEREENMCTYKKFVRKRPRRVTRRNEDK